MTRLAAPTIFHHGDCPSLSQVQKTKPPPISARAEKIKKVMVFMVALYWRKNG